MHTVLALDFGWQLHNVECEVVEVHKAETCKYSIAQVLRRMVFASNRNLIQSEAVLTMPAASSAQPAPPPAGGGTRNKNAEKRTGPATQQQPAPSSQPAGGAAAAAAAEAGSGAAAPAIDHSQLPCEYHQAIVAGLCLASAHPPGPIALHGSVASAATNSMCLTCSRTCTCWLHIHADLELLCCMRKLLRPIPTGALARWRALVISLSGKR